MVLFPIRSFLLPPRPCSFLCVTRFLAGGRSARVRDAVATSPAQLPQDNHTMPPRRALTPRSPRRPLPLQVPAVKRPATSDSDLWQQFGGANSVNHTANARPAAARHMAATGPRPQSPGRSVITTNNNATKASTDSAFLQAHKGKTAAQLRELSADLLADLKRLRANVRVSDEVVCERERAKQTKMVELRNASAGSALDWVLLKAQAHFPESWDADIEQARDAVHSAQLRVNEVEAKLLAVQELLAKSSAQANEGSTTLFIHFIPPPLRANGKSDLPWIIHKCDGSGCHEARHVSILSVSGFSTFEGAPPEQAEGKACRCQIANHHLRGYGKLRWEGSHHAIVENDSAGDNAMINGLAYREQARRQVVALAQARDELKRLRAVRDEMAQAQSQELLEARSALAALQEQFRALSTEHELLKIKHETQSAEWQKRYAEKLEAQNTASFQHPVAGEHTCKYDGGCSAPKWPAQPSLWV